MSSILRALKKLESDPKHMAERSSLESKFVPLADTGQQKTPAGLIMIVLGGGIVCGLVILAGWWLFSETSGTPSLAPQEISQKNQEQAEMFPAIAREAAVSEPEALEVAPSIPAADITAPTKIADELPETPAAKITEPSSPAIMPKNVRPDDEPALESAARETSAPGPEIAAEAPPQEVAVADTRIPDISTSVKEIEIPVLYDPEMKLQAITWSKDPQKRIVVINNRILHQGDAVSGYLIDTINQDDVLLSDAGEKWKLLFRIK